MDNAQLVYLLHKAISEDDGNTLMELYSTYGEAIRSLRISGFLRSFASFLEKNNATDTLEELGAVNVGPFLLSDHLSAMSDYLHPPLLELLDRHTDKCTGELYGYLTSISWEKRDVALTILNYMNNESVYAAFRNKTVQQQAVFLNANQLLLQRKIPFDDKTISQAFFQRLVDVYLSEKYNLNQNLFFYIFVAGAFIYPYFPREVNHGISQLFSHAQTHIKSVESAFNSILSKTLNSLHSYHADLSGFCANVFNHLPSSDDKAKMVRKAFDSASGRYDYDSIEKRLNKGPVWDIEGLNQLAASMSEDDYNQDYLHSYLKKSLDRLDKHKVFYECLLVHVLTFLKSDDENTRTKKLYALHYSLRHARVFVEIDYLTEQFESFYMVAEQAELSSDTEMDVTTLSKMLDNGTQLFYGLWELLQRPESEYFVGVEHNQMSLQLITSHLGVYKALELARQQGHSDAVEYILNILSNS